MAVAEPGVLWMHTDRRDSLEDVADGLGARHNEPMARHTTLRIGGPADWFLEASNCEDIVVASIVMRSRGLTMTMIGNGSNLLVSDKGIRGLVVKPSGSLANITDHGGGTLHVGAGVKLLELARHFRDAGIGGLEWAFGVPGYLGGSLFMNAGTPQGEIQDVVESVIVIGRSGRQQEIPRAECGFGYRSSRFQRTHEVIVGAIIQMGGKPYDARLAQDLMDRRKATQPLTLPNCGSIFSNPPGQHAGKLIEDCGLKGKIFGGAQVSPQHSNFIVNLGRASAHDVRTLITICADEVRKRFGVELKCEVRMCGEW